VPGEPYCWQKNTSGSEIFGAVSKLRQELFKDLDRPRKRKPETFKIRLNSIADNVATMFELVIRVTPQEWRDELFDPFLNDIAKSLEDVLSPDDASTSYLFSGLIPESQYLQDYMNNRELQALPSTDESLAAAYGAAVASAETAPTISSHDKLS
jgi:hypothetical protein